METRSDFINYGMKCLEQTYDYLENIESRKVLPDVKPGYLKSILPEMAPYEPENPEDVINDIESKIIPGISHWHHPNFHAYYPTANSYPALLADIFINGFSVIGFSWISSPVCTELELIVMDWLCKEMKLPDFYLNSIKDGKGGGVLQNSVSEGILVSIIAAKAKKFAELKEIDSNFDENKAKTKLVSYISDQAHSCSEKATIFADVICRKLPTDNKFSLRGDTLEEFIEKDIKNGFIPFMLTATLGTTSLCAFDCLTELGPICKKHNIWLNVDAAYAGSALICSELRDLMKGIEYTDSFIFNPNKWMRVNFDATCFWIREKEYLINTLSLNPEYLRDEFQPDAPDLRHWSVSFGRKFRSLKVWFVLRMLGVKGIQQYIRSHVLLAKYFETLILSDERFEIVGQVTLGLVCFRLKGPNELNKKLIKKINDEGILFMISSEAKGISFLRFCLGAASTQQTHVKFAFDIISRNADELLKEHNLNI